MPLHSPSPLSVLIRQAPVGQGGLCSGVLRSQSHELTWVFDCGSNQLEPLVAEIAALAPTIDLLFISHLDEDHVCGLDVLLSNHRVTEVVLPYLTDNTRVLLTASAASRGRLTGNFLDLIDDPVAWFTARGVQRVVAVGWPTQGEDDAIGGAFPIEPRPPGEGGLKTKWARPTQATPKMPGAQKVPAEAPLLVTTAGANGGGAVDFVFIPHVHPPKPRLLNAFEIEIRKYFPGQTMLQVVQAARSEAGRLLLRQCYEQIWADHNLISMSLYTGPTGNGSAWRTSLPSHWPPHMREAQAGWISTGDASFGAEVRRRAFERTYSAVCREVAVLVTPHHGSALSWHPEILAALPNLAAGVAAAGPNGYGHPHSAVKADFDRSGLDFHQVSEHPSTGFTLRAWSP